MNFGQNELCFRDIHFKKNIKIVIQLVEIFQLLEKEKKINCERKKCFDLNF